MKKINLKKGFKEDGFTLIETTIVLLVIAMLSLLILPNITGVNSNVSSSTDKAIVTTVKAQIELYKANNNNVSPSDKELVDGEYVTQEQLDIYNKKPKD